MPFQQSNGPLMVLGVLLMFGMVLELWALLDSSVLDVTGSMFLLNPIIHFNAKYHQRIGNCLYYFLSFFTCKLIMTSVKHKFRDVIPPNQSIEFSIEEGIAMFKLVVLNMSRLP